MPTMAEPTPTSIGLYRIRSERLRALAADLGSLQSDTEHERAERFVASEDREAFRIHHGVLRLILGQQIRAPAGSLHIQTGEQGKPKLVGPTTDGLPEFNMSHTKGLALIAIGYAGPIGVDCERADRVIDPDLLGRRILAPTERAALSDLDGVARRALFLHYWTGKEAYLKALGQGIGTSLRDIELGTPGPTPIADRRTDAPDPAYWLHPVDAGSEYIAALVTPSARIELRMIDVMPTLVTHWLHADAAM